MGNEMLYFESLKKFYFINKSVLPCHPNQTEELSKWTRDISKRFKSLYNLFVFTGVALTSNSYTKGNNFVSSGSYQAKC